MDGLSNFGTRPILNYKILRGEFEGPIGLTKPSNGANRDLGPGLSLKNYEMDHPNIIE